MNKRHAFLGLFQWRPQGLWVRVCDENAFARVQMLLTRTDRWPERVARAQAATGKCAGACAFAPAGASEASLKSAGACAFDRPAAA